MRPALAVTTVLALACMPAAAAPAQDHMPDRAGRPGSPAEPGATGPTRDVAIGFSAFSPQHVDVMTGDTVRWTNASVRTHTVTAQDDLFDSGRLQPGDVFARTFTAPGPVPYFCRLHPIPGRVDVHRLLLADPGPPGAPGHARDLRGRTALAPGSEVGVEVDEGAGFRTLQTAVVDAQGAVAATVRPLRTATYRLSAGADASPARTLVILDRRLTISVRPLRGRRLRVSSTVTPASSGTPAVLQLRLPHRFGWWPVARATVGDDSRLRFTIPRRRRVPLRVVLTLPDGATVLASSRVLRGGGPRR